MALCSLTWPQALQPRPPHPICSCLEPVGKVAHLHSDWHLPSPPLPSSLFHWIKNSTSISRNHLIVQEFECASKEAEVHSRSSLGG